MRFARPTVAGSRRLTIARDGQHPRSRGAASQARTGARPRTRPPPRPGERARCRARRAADGAGPDGRLCRGRGGRRLVVRLARAAVRCRTHGHRFGVARARAFRACVRQPTAYGARILWPRPGGSARRVRQRDRDARHRRRDRRRGREAAHRARAGRGGRGARRRDRGTRGEPVRRVAAVRRDRVGQCARRAAARDGRRAGLGRGDRRGRGDPRHRLDADRPDPVGRRRTADPALDVAVAAPDHRRADGARARASRLRGDRPGARVDPRRARRSRSPRVGDGRGRGRAVRAHGRRVRRGVAGRARRLPAADARAVRHPPPHAAAGLAAEAAVDGAAGDPDGRQGRRRPGLPALAHPRSRDPATEGPRARGKRARLVSGGRFATASPPS